MLLYMHSFSLGRASSSLARANLKGARAKHELRSLSDDSGDLRENAEPDKEARIGSYNATDIVRFRSITVAACLSI